MNKKFDALKEAEGRGWVEEHKPPPRQKKVVKVKTPKCCFKMFILFACKFCLV